MMGPYVHVFEASQYHFRSAHRLQSFNLEQPETKVRNWGIGPSFTVVSS